jgi:hypothetical protein
MTLFLHPTTVTSDVDSTLADTTQRRHLINSEQHDATDWTAYARACAADAPTPVIDLLHLLGRVHNIVLITSRPEPARSETIAWLSANHVMYDALIMDDGEYETPTQFKVAAVEQVNAISPVVLHLDDWWGVGQAVMDTLGIPSVTVSVYPPVPAMTA